MAGQAQVSGVAAGVPFVVTPPATPLVDAPVVIGWHLMDAPRTEAAFAAALPLEALDAWRVYLGLPMFGSRTPAGGLEEVMSLAYDDAVLKLHGPVAVQAVAECAPAFAQLREQFGLGAGPIGLLGGSIGAAVAQLVLTEGELEVSAAVLVSPVVQMRAMVDAMSRHFNVTYDWTDAAVEVAARVDFVARAGEIAKRGEPAILCIVGGDDDEEGFLVPANKLRDELAARYDDPERVAVRVVPGMEHALAEEPGIEPARQTSSAKTVDGLAVDWFRLHLKA